MRTKEEQKQFTKNQQAEIEMYDQRPVLENIPDPEGRVGLHAVSVHFYYKDTKYALADLIEEPISQKTLDVINDLLQSANLTLTKLNLES